jgi:GT2 family glycosyltransferase
MKLDKDALRVIIGRADEFRDAQQWLQAATLYGEVLEHCPQSAGLWVQYAHLLKEGEFLEEALTAYRTAISLDGTEPDPRHHLAHLLKRLGRNEEALVEFRALSLLPDAPQVEQEIAGLIVALAQIDSRTEAPFTRRDVRPEAATCLSGFLRLQKMEEERLETLVGENGEEAGRGWPLVALSDTSVFGQLSHLVKGHQLKARLDPKAHLIIDGGRFLATTDNPQFSLIFEGTLSFPGWFQVEMKLSDTKFDPVLYLEHSPRWARFSTVRMEHRRNGLYRAIFFSREPLLSVRLDPMSHRAAFYLKKICFKQLSWAQILLQAHRRDPIAFRQALYSVASHRFGKQFAHKIEQILKPSQGDRYQIWLARHDLQTRRLVSRRKRVVEGWLERPLISIVVNVSSGCANDIETTIQSLLSQIYTHWQLTLVGTSTLSKAAAEAINKYKSDARVKVNFAESPSVADVMDISEGEFIIVVKKGDLLLPSALFLIAERLISLPSSQLIYTDEDAAKDGRPQSPLLKPDWDPDYFAASNYVGQFVAIHRMLIAKSLSPSMAWNDLDIYDLVLRAVELIDASNIAHISHILYRRHVYQLEQREDLLPGAMTERRQDALRASLERQGKDAVVVEEPAGFCRIVWPVPKVAPLVTLIIPTRDSYSLLRSSVESILQHTNYPAFEITVVDNDSSDPETLAYFDRLAAIENVQVLHAPGSFNYSLINNLAVERARGSIVGLINNDVLATEGGWLREMVSHAVRSDVGAVGAKLLYRTGHVQHAGIVCGIGIVAGHPHKFRSGDDPGYMARLAVTQSFSAVTGACLVVEKEKYQRVGGLDANNLQVAFNDVDLCLKLSAIGYRNVYTPYASLIHLESVSRGIDRTPEQVRRYRKEADFMIEKWGDRLRADPYYNPNLTADREDFSIGD